MSDRPESGSPFKDHFSGHARHYAAHRPGYPAELFDFLAAECRARDLAWDCATGNGQAARSLASRFRRVVATDASAEQIASAEPAEGVDFYVAPAEASALPAGSVDLVTVAQALHWFNIERFFEEADRVLKPGGLLACWSYHHCRVEPAIDELIESVFAEVEHFDPEETGRMLDGLRASFADYPAAQITVRQFENGPPINAPIEVRIVGPDLETLRALATDVERIVMNVDGTRDVNNPMRLQRTDLDLRIDTEKAAMFGVPAIEADRTVRLAVAGLPAGRFRQPDGDEYDITLRLPIEGRPTLGLLDEIQVSSLAGGQVPLRQISDPHFRTTPNVIHRYDGERSISITAWPQTGYVTDDVTRSVFAALAKMEWPPGYRYTAAGEVEAREEAFGGLGVALLVAMFGILAVLVLEFGSFRSTLIVFGVVPLGMVGATVGLFLTGYTLSFTALIGMIALVGIEIKNSILLVDFTNQLRENGAGLDEAIEKAGEVRFFPILLTSLTAIGGLTPLAIQGSGLYSPLAIVIIGGLISSTLLARLVTPVMYKLLPPAIEPRKAAALAARPAETAG